MKQSQVIHKIVKKNFYIIWSPLLIFVEAEFHVQYTASEEIYHISFIGKTEISL